MGTPMAFTSGTTNGFSLGATKRATVALNPATSLVSGNNWFNGVDVSNQYLIYSDTFSQGQAPITTARPTAWTTPDLTDASLLALINTLPDRVGQVPYTDINVALQWLQNSEKYFLIKNGYDNIVTNGLVFNVDAGWANSYPGNTNTWFDTIGGKNMTLMNGPVLNNNNGGNIRFDGTDDYATSFTTPTSLLGDPNFTICSWMRRTGDGGGNTGTWGLSGDGNGINSWWYFNNNEIAIDTWGQATFTTGVQYPLNEWVFVVWQKIAGPMTRDNCILWKNLTKYTGNQLTILRAESVAPNIGNNGVNLARISQTYTTPVPIDIGLFSIYNRVLSTQEITQNYNATKSRFGFGGQSLFSGVTQYLDFSKQSSYPGTGTNLNDVSGNGYNDTITDASQVKYIDGVKCLDCSTGAQINGDTSNSPTLGNNYTIFTWARVISSTANFRTLLRTFDDDHPLLVESGGNTIGYYNNNSIVFVASSLNVSTLGLADRWVLYTIVGSSGTQQTFYINEGTSNSTVSANATGEKMDDICNHSGQIFGPVGSCVVYNNQAFTQSQVTQYFNATKQYYGYNAQNVLTYGLITSYDAGNPISYPGTGTTWYDLTGNGNNGTLYNSPTYSNGEISFDGVDDYMQANILNKLLDGDPNFSVEFFVKRTSDFANGGFWGIGGAGQGNSIEGWTPTQNEIHLDLYDSTRLSSGQYYPLNTYVHVVWAKSGTSISTSTVNLYINGVLTNLTLTRSQTTGPRYNTSTPGVGIALGRINGNASSLYAPITVGTFRIYDRQLTQGEVLNNYNAQKSRFGL